MTMRRGLRHGIAGVASLAVVMSAITALSGCSANAHPPASSAPTAAASAPARPSPASTTHPTCTGILTVGTVHALTQAGWSPRQDPFYIGNMRMSGGIQCTWGDPRHPTDDVQLYGWAPTTPARTRAAEQELDASGWRRLVDGGDTCYTAVGGMITTADSDGFGMTYCFAGDHVTVADTRQGLLLVRWPPSS